MEITYNYGGERELLTSVDAEVKDVEIRKVFTGLTLITEEGERLSICMRDSGFEVHYYSDPEQEKGFDLGWFEFKAGTASISDEIVEQATLNMPVIRDQRKAERTTTWLKASVIVDKMIEEQGPLAPYRAGAPFGPGSIVTVADQRFSLIRDLANWLLEEAQ